MYSYKCPCQGMMPNYPMMYPMAAMPYMQNYPMMDGFDEDSDDHEDERRDYEDENVSEVEPDEVDPVIKGDFRNIKEEDEIEDPALNEDARKKPPTPQYGPGVPGYYPPKFPGQYLSPAEIERIIEFGHPNILRTMMSYGIPYNVARQLIGRIIRITLRHCR